MKKDLNLNNQLDRENIIKEYLIYIKDVKNYSPNTVKSYKSDINHYIKNSQKIGEFSDYLRQLNKNQYSKTSINRKITSINLFLSWAVENNYFNKNKIKKGRMLTLIILTKVAIIPVCSLTEYPAPIT